MRQGGPDRSVGDLAWQLSVPAIGFTHVDQLHPGCRVARPNVTPPNVTSSNSPLLKVPVEKIPDGRRKEIPQV